MSLSPNRDRTATTTNYKDTGSPIGSGMTAETAGIVPRQLTGPAKILLVGPRQAFRRRRFRQAPQGQGCLVSRLLRPE